MPAEQAPSQFVIVVLLLLLFGLMWWSSKRARRQRDELEQMRDTLTPGTRVMTGSGLFGTVLRIEGDRVFLDVGSGQVTEWLLQAIVKVDESAFDETAFAEAVSALDDVDVSAFDDSLDDFDDARGPDELDDLTEPDDSAR